MIYTKNINQGGLADSLWVGAENSVARMCGFNLHSTPGVLKSNQVLVDLDPATPDEIDDFVKAIVVCSDGNTYMFGSTEGKVWKKDSDNLVEHIGTVEISETATGVLSAAEFNGHIYYATENWLGRIAVTDAATWASATDNWNEFENGDEEFHPMQVMLLLYIGDGKDIASVDTDDSFSESALFGGIQEEYRIKSLGKIGTSLLIGTHVSDNVHETRIMRWDTWSLKISSFDPIPETSIHAFLQTDNVVFAVCGEQGHIYYYNGQELEEFKRVPGNYDRNNNVTMHSGAVANWDGLPLFALSDKDGKAIDNGVYSLGSHSRNYPKVLNLENSLSFGLDDTREIEIGAIAVDDNGLVVSWKRAAHLALPEEVGVDITHNSVKNKAFFETRVMNLGREAMHTMQRHMVAYVDLPENTDIKIYQKVNYGDWEEMTSVVDAINKHKSAELSQPFYTLQVKVESIPKDNTAPIIEELISELNG